MKQNVFSIDSRCLYGRPEIVKAAFEHYTCCNLRGLAGREHLWKIELPSKSKIYQNRLVRDLRVRFAPFGGVLAKD